MMDMDEAIDRVHALDRWVCLYLRSNTFAQFHADYAAQDPELKAFLDAAGRENWPQELLDVLHSLGESIDMGQFLESQDKPWRRISDGPSYARDGTMDHLYAQVPADYRVSDVIAAVFEPIKARLSRTNGSASRGARNWTGLMTSSKA